MPLLIVPGHHDSPKLDRYSFSDPHLSDIPVNRTFRQPRTRKLTNGIIASSKDALDKILIDPDHNFSWYSVSNRTQWLVTDDLDTDDYQELTKKWEDPSLQSFAGGRIEASGSTHLITKDSQYATNMKALLEVMWTLPVISVLQAGLFDPKMFQNLTIHNRSWSWAWLSHKWLISEYPFGILHGPKRVWPDFYHAHTWEQILRVSHHPDKNNDPHYDAFRTDPRLWNIQDGNDLELVMEKLNSTLMPIIEWEMTKINEAHTALNQVNEHA